MSVRAQVADHLQRNFDSYAKTWDHEMPDGTASTDFKAYIAAVSKVGTWAGQMEVAALARMFDTKIIIYPLSLAFPVCAVALCAQLG